MADTPTVPQTGPVAGKTTASIDPAALKSMSGLDLLRELIEGRLPPPPISDLMSFTIISLEKGIVVFGGTPGRQHYNPLGAVHGGYAATLLDSCMGCAVHSTLDAGLGYTTLEIKINYLRGMTDKTGPIRAEGRVLQSGRRAAMAEGRIVDGAGRLLAHGTTTCLVFPL